jgi:hypothetical protein
LYISFQHYSSQDVSEADRRLRELGVPFFHHELVKSALLRCLEDPARRRDPLLALLAAFSASGVIYPSQMHKGFQRVADSMEDVLLDYPAAREQVRGHLSDVSLPVSFFPFFLFLIQFLSFVSSIPT